jgi:hypothetical protein
VNEWKKREKKKKKKEEKAESLNGSKEVTEGANSLQLNLSTEESGYESDLTRKSNSDKVSLMENYQERRQHLFMICPPPRASFIGRRLVPLITE